MDIKQYSLKDLSKPQINSDGVTIGHEKIAVSLSPELELPEGIDIEIPQGRLTSNPFYTHRNSNMNIDYIQDISGISGINKLLSHVGEDISKSLVKTTPDGTRVIVPRCEYHAYPILLDKEIESARNLIKKPNFGRAIVFTILGWVLVAAFIGDILGLSGSDYFVAYATVLGATVGNYLNTIWDNNKQTATLAEIRTTLLEQYMSSMS